VQEGALIFDSIIRPEVTADRYRELEMVAMQSMMQFPHHNLGECLIIRDIQTNILRRWLMDERIARHQPADAIAEAINQGTVVRLVTE
jgi:hypothetical protein